MKARIENGRTKIYGKLPSKYRSATLNIAGGFHRADKEVLESEGFFNVEIPDYDQDTQKLGTLFFDNNRKIFTYTVEEDESVDIESIRESKLKEFNEILEKQMTPALMYGVLEKLAMGEDISLETRNLIVKLRDREIRIKNKIKAITDVKKLKKFSFDQSEIAMSKEALKAQRDKDKQK